MNSNNRLVRLAGLQALACASGMLLSAPGNASASGDNSTAPTPTPASSTAADPKKGPILLAQANTNPPADQGSAAKSTADDSALTEIIVVGVKQAIATSQNIKK